MNYTIPEAAAPFGSRAPVHDQVVGVALIILGLIVTFFGRRLFRVILFAAGFMTVSTLMYRLCLHIRPPPLSTESHALHWIYLSISIGFGLLGGLVCLYQWWMGMALVGALGGSAIALLVYNICPAAIPPGAARAVLTIGLAVAMIVAIFWFEKLITILATALAGATATVDGMDVFAGVGLYRHMSNFISMEREQPGSFRLTGPMIVLLAAIGAITLIGFICQMLHSTRYTLPRSHEPEPALGCFGSYSCCSCCRNDDY